MFFVLCKIGPLKSFYGVPRFGHSSDITDIFTDEGDLDFNKIFDYLMGTIFVAAFLLATFLVFVFFLLVFKIVGRDAGILGGFPFVEDKKLLFGRPKKNLIFRCLMLLLTSIVVAGGGVFLGKGTQQVRRVASDVRDGTTVSILVCTRTKVLPMMKTTHQKNFFPKIGIQKCFTESC